MRATKVSIAMYFVLLVIVVDRFGLQNAPSPNVAAVSANQVIDRMSQHEKAMVSAMRGYHPMAETYFQIVRPDEELGTVPTSDRYFLGRLDFGDSYHVRFFDGELEKSGWKAVAQSTLTPAKRLGRFFSIDFLPTGFSGMIFPDARGFDRENYSFQFVIAANSWAKFAVWYSMLRRATRMSRAGFSGDLD